jgi:hypothetical protein
MMLLDNREAALVKRESCRAICCCDFDLFTKPYNYVCAQSWNKEGIEQEDPTLRVRAI